MSLNVRRPPKESKKQQPPFLLLNINNCVGKKAQRFSERNETSVCLKIPAQKWLGQQQNISICQSLSNGQPNQMIQPMQCQKINHDHFQLQHNQHQRFYWPGSMYIWCWFDAWGLLYLDGWTSPPQPNGACPEWEKARTRRWRRRSVPGKSSFWARRCWLCRQSQAAIRRDVARFSASVSGSRMPDAR